MAKIKCYDTDLEFQLVLDKDDVQDLMEIQLQKKTNMPDTIEACFHAGLVTILTHCPRPKT